MNINDPIIRLKNTIKHNICALSIYISPTWLHAVSNPDPSSLYGTRIFDDFQKRMAVLNDCPYSSSFLTAGQYYVGKIKKKLTMITEAYACWYGADMVLISYLYYRHFLWLRSTIIFFWFFRHSFSHRVFNAPDLPDPSAFYYIFLLITVYQGQFLKFPLVSSRHR